MGVARALWVGVTVILLVCHPAVHAGDAGIDPRKPSHRDRWRVAYYEGGPYLAYKHTLIALVKGLTELGWIGREGAEGYSQEGAREIWGQLATRPMGDYIQFVEDAFYSADWSPEDRKRIAAAVIDRFNRRKDIDLVIAMGTWAGQDLAKPLHTVPTVVMSTSDPLGSGIIRSADDSGQDHVHARIEPRYHERQLRLFHDTVGFKTLGVIYEDTVAGRSYAAMDTVETLSGAIGFGVAQCTALSDIPDVRVAESNST